jgi:hypothetical protein
MISTNQLLSQLGLHAAYCAEIAKQHQFKSRNRSVHCFHYVVAILETCNNHVVSFNKLAASIAIQFQAVVSRQAIHQALHAEAFTKYFDDIFSAFIAFKLTNSLRLPDFNRIIIQDSTIVKLPQRLFADFSGVKNKSTQVANARIQLALNLSNHSLSLFSLDGYSKPDISEAKALPIEKGDLILRDRGYLSVQEIQRLQDSNAFYIFRYKFKMKYFDINTGNILCLLTMLRNEKSLDILARLGTPDGPIVRITAQPVSEELANERRRKAKKEYKTNPSKNNLEIMGWTIFITNLFNDQYSFAKILQMYGIRWNIEIVFKALKSELNLEGIHNVAKYQLRFIVQARIMRFLLIYHFIAAIEQLHRHQKLKPMPNVSFLKLTQVLSQNNKILIKMWLEILQNKILSNESTTFLNRYCAYEKRKRNNANTWIQIH